MLNKLASSVDSQYKVLNIVIAESESYRRDLLTKAIAKYRGYHNIITIGNIEDVFSLMYEEVTIDAIFFDVEKLSDINDISIINAISPKIAFLHWSNCQHPEIIELLHDLGVNSFCLKNSRFDIIIAAIDSIATNPNILYVDEHLKQCLPLLAS